MEQPNEAPRENPETSEISGGGDQAPRRLTDPASMRALSHPVRLALIEVLTLHGALTATQAGELIGETPTTCSFHLRQLAKYGFVEEAGPMPGRSRPWRVTRLGWSTENDAPADTAVAARHLGELTLERQLDRHRAHERDAHRAHTVWWATPDEAAELQGEIDELVMRYRDRLQDPSKRPEGAEAIEVVILTHPFA
ncbi:helix-turn-helix domain-containing protein [Streptomyces sp. NBC_00572]|uniref:winged helix-turn-helix domain-containing protein n=1 Tax=Streptomyces sp. NBC_00572 TaxID=2903664 RepID=UPI0022587F1F|nr:helix-turn-helix domain-containing protein [Streptomyces sp. NBC_00572]MCX4981474.1 helix-turn-helix domain-containing protein [Streptomyces sp. NBC_00572]